MVGNLALRIAAAKSSSGDSTCRWSPWSERLVAIVRCSGPLAAGCHGTRHDVGLVQVHGVWVTRLTAIALVVLLLHMRRGSSRTQRRRERCYSES